MDCEYFGTVVFLFRSGRQHPLLAALFVRVNAASLDLSHKIIRLGGTAGITRACE
jgi:hypothetical protein